MAAPTANSFLMFMISVILRVRFALSWAGYLKLQVGYSVEILMPGGLRVARALFVGSLSLLPDQDHSCTWGRRLVATLRALATREASVSVFSCVGSAGV
jgi:hypothetical protein